MNSNPFRTLETLRKSFVKGLEILVSDPCLSLPSFVLATANAMFFPQVLERISGDLERRLSSIQPSGDPEDLLILQQIKKFGWGDPVEHKQVGRWEVQLNTLRASRPKRQAVEGSARLSKGFDTNAFHYNLPFLRPEIFWSGDLAGREATLLYNKYPFVESHLILVLERGENLPQFLTQAAHQYAWDVVSELSHLRGCGLGYNSLGASASVNHLHFQFFADRDPLPVMLPMWAQNGGPEKYPATTYMFSEVGAAWDWLKSAHGRNIPYNLVYTPGRVYCFPRKFQGKDVQLSWTSGLAWYEMSGGFIVSNREDYDGFSVEGVKKALSDLHP